MTNAVVVLSVKNGVNFMTKKLENLIILAKILDNSIE